MHNRKQNRTVIALLAVMFLSIAFFSFSSRPGGDHFEVYLNKKLVFTQIVNQPATPKSITLDHRNADDQVNVFYSHCGKIGSKRTIAIKEGKNVLKQWRFSDAAGKFMSVEAEDILAFQNKNGDKKIDLYYSSAEIPEGRLLASIVLDNKVNKAIP